MARRKSRKKPKKAIVSARVAIDQAVALCKNADRLFKSHQDETDENKVQQALSLLEKAETLLSPYPHISVDGLYSAMAKCHYALGHRNNALVSAQKELARNPDDLRVRHFYEHLQSYSGILKFMNLRFNGISPPEQWPSVSLCMIVKNEESHLGDCLRSVGDFADEIIIVDTGSTDRTVEIATEFGARVEHFEWVADFAAARNYSISFATGEWIFWMDADDRLSPEALARAKQALISNKAVIYSFLVQSPEGTQISQARHHRLFRNGLGLHFERPMHEHLNLQTKSLTVANTNIIVNHTGYAVDAKTKQRKYRRNLEIIQKMVAANPEDTYWRHHLGVCQFGLENYAAAIEEFERVLLAPSHELSIDFDLYQAFVLGLEAYQRLENWEDQEKLIIRAKKTFPQHSHLYTYLGRIYLVRGQPALAQEHLERAQKMPAPSTGSSIAYSQGKVNRWLSRAYLQQKKYALAKQSLGRYERESGEITTAAGSADLENLKLLLENKAYREAIRLYRKYIYRDAFVARKVAQAYIELNQWRNALEALENAVILSAPAEGEWAILAECAVHVNAFHVAQRYCELALAEGCVRNFRIHRGARGESPRIPPGLPRFPKILDAPLAENNKDLRALNLMGIIAFQHKKELPEAVAYFVRALAIDPNFAPAFNNLEQLAVAMNRTPVFLLREQGKQLLNNQDTQAAVTIFAATLQKFPQDIETHRLLALALQQMGQTEDAIRVWQTAAHLESRTAVGAVA